MGKGRMEAFSDGVLAIIITIMVIELRPPHGDYPAALLEIKNKFFSYILSFVYLAIYWNNHHHMLQAAKEVNGKVLWYNVFLLFCLSLVPFVTSWMGENNFSTWPVALYGVVLLMAAFAYYFLARSLVSHHGTDSILGEALGRDWKGKLSIIIYILGIGLCFVYPLAGFSLYVLVAAMWFIPDRRLEKKLKQENK